MAALSLIVAGLCSAGLSHGVVRSLTALGAVHGSYASYRHDAIAAAMLAAAVVGGAIGVVGLGCAFASGVCGRDAWFAALQSTIANLGPRPTFAVVVVVQFLAIVGIESIEQFAQFGHTLGLVGALGAPLIVAIPIQLVCALAVVVSLFALARAVMRAEARMRGWLSPVIHVKSCTLPVAALMRPYRASDDIVRPAPLALRFANRPPPSRAA
jgi:hypothetical protein